jgi:DNA-binding transcriptional LysR family regulator
MRPHLPPLNALKAFEAAARHESFTRAAEELCVTQGAVSHQVKALEAELAIKLFNRERQRLVITEAGRDYLNVVRDALDRIAVGTERLLQRQNAGVLTVSTSPDFAAKWLVHRLGHFAEAHTGIDLRVSATLHHVDFAHEEVDLAVRHGDGNWPGLDTVRLSTEQLFAVCSPKLLSGRRRLGKLSDILKFPLIHLDSRSDWTNWLQGVGSHQRPAGAAVPGFAAFVEDLLDRLPEGDRWSAEDRDLSRLASFGSVEGFAPPKDARFAIEAIETGRGLTGNHHTRLAQRAPLMRIFQAEGFRLLVIGEQLRIARP